jgi:hypothetical protein
MMNPLRELKLNQPGRIEPLGAPTKNGVDGTVRQISKELILLELRESNEAPEFQVGQRVTFKYWDVFGLHRGETEIMGVSPRRPTELSVAPPDRVELTQKRKFFRVNVSVPVVIQRRTANTNAAPEAPLKTRTEDLTPAGMRITSPRSFEVGEIVEATIDFAASTGDATPVNVISRVVRAGRIVRDAPADTDSFTTSVQFLDLPDEEQSRISLLLFELQRHIIT